MFFSALNKIYTQSGAEFFTSPSGGESTTRIQFMSTRPQQIMRKKPPKGKKFELEVPPVVKYLNSVLQSYPEGGQIIREALQNASDSAADSFEVWLDLNNYGTEDSGGGASGGQSGPVGHGVGVRRIFL